MASSSFNSSSSASNPSAKHDAFLSFRGADTRNKFRSHLRAALWEEGIKTFTDDENMETGEYVSPQLIQAIENSRCSIIIISPHYASSKWCLIELVKILDCMTNTSQFVFPIFYHVERCDVENQTGDFGKAFGRLESDSEVEMELTASWRDALAVVAKLPGFDIQDSDEAEFVKEIVEEVWSKLSNVAASNISDDFWGWNSSVGGAKITSCLFERLTGVANTPLAFFFLLC